MSNTAKWGQRPRRQTAAGRAGVAPRATKRLNVGHAFGSGRIEHHAWCMAKRFTPIAITHTSVAHPVPIMCQRTHAVQHLSTRLEPL